MKAYNNVDEYIDAMPAQSRPYLKILRQTIKTEVPEAGEKISYGIASFTLNDKYFIYIGGYEKHVSLYPIPAGDKAFKQELAPYVAGKGTVRFPLDKPLPLGLIRKMVQFAAKQRREKVGY